MRQTARLITTGTFEEGQVNILGSSYPATFDRKHQELYDNGELDLSVEKLLILVPNTLHSSVFNHQDEQDSYLDFTIIGSPINQDINDLDLDIVKITGKVIYENVKHGFVLVKIQKGSNEQKIKLVGRLNQSATQDDYGNVRGTAVDKFYKIEAVVRGKQLVICDSWRIRPEAQVIQFPTRRTNAYQPYQQRFAA